MEIKQAFLLALKSLSSSKMRSLLTMLGIIIGVAAVIILVSLVNGMTKDIVNSFESMGTNLLNVTVIPRGGITLVSVDDMLEVADENTDSISYVTPMVTVGNLTIKNGDTNITTSGRGTNEYYKDIANLKVEQGRYIEYVDVDKRQKRCVIGTYVQNELFENESALGKEIKINGQSYIVVGVLEETADSTESSVDNIVYIPYTTATSLSRNRIINTFTFSAKSKDVVEDAKNAIIEKLSEFYTSTDNYRITDQSQILDSLNEMVGKMESILVGIAGISLLVGGIGIMNIMLVSVTERTREIGIRKALGATPWDILSQFVVEAATTSSIGGVIGILLGIGLSYVAARALDLSAAISVGAIIIAFSVSAAIGIAFGYFPAKKAARLNPIEALRYD